MDWTAIGAIDSVDSAKPGRIKDSFILIGGTGAYAPYLDHRHALIGFGDERVLGV